MPDTIESAVFLRFTIRPMNTQRTTSGQIADKRIFNKKRKAQKQRKSSISELFDLVTRTGIEPMIPP